MALEQGVDERLDWTIDWKKALKGGDSIDLIEWSAPGLTWDEPHQNGTTASCFISGGEAGKTYVVKCKLTSTYGRVYTRKFRLSIVAEP